MLYATIDVAMATYANEMSVYCQAIIMIPNIACDYPGIAIWAPSVNYVYLGP